MIGDILSTIYPYTKALHIIAVITWMAGIFYLPRLFVHHTEQTETGSETDALFQMMERKLLKLIMNPSIFAVWIFGLMLVFTPGIVDWTDVWPYTKGASILAMTWFHHWLGKRRKDFVAGNNQLTGRQYRMMNEVPTILLLVIVFSVVLKF
ncbi:CopD family protein [Actibacterium ureilyticum]|uniref:CopD family protein n=1 Tax=Actibacterium ureilyticum TaxID=1590614 RepID=UPI000BAAFCD4|nr:CopD family protein [Actibacterium ureilyticum]